MRRLASFFPVLGCHGLVIQRRDLGGKPGRGSRDPRYCRVWAVCPAPNRFARKGILSLGSFFPSSGATGCWLGRGDVGVGPENQVQYPHPTPPRPWPAPILRAEVSPC